MPVAIIKVLIKITTKIVIIAIINHFKTRSCGSSQSIKLY